LNMDVMRAKYQVLADRPEYQRLKASTHIIGTWDDHDFGADDSGRNYRMKEESKEVFLEFFEEPKRSKRRKHEGVYTSYEFGPKEQRVQIILLDLRTFRSPLIKGANPLERDHAGPYRPNLDLSSTIMGEDQWRWLKKQLKRPAKVRLIGSSIQFAAEFHGWEGWANFPNERKRFIDLAASTKADGVVLLSGDMHYGELSVMKNETPYPLYDFTSSGINRVWEHEMVNIHRLSQTEYRPHVGWIEFDWAEDPEIRFRLQVVDGYYSVDHRVRLSEISHK
jgi:alkaline phosphatase D